MLDEGRMNRVRAPLEPVSLADGGHFHFASCTRVASWSMEIKKGQLEIVKDLTESLGMVNTGHDVILKYTRRYPLSSSSMLSTLSLTKSS